MGYPEWKNVLWTVHSSTSREVFVSEQDMGHPDRTDPNFAAGRDEWVIPSGKMPSGLYIAVRPEGIFLLGISQAPGPSESFS